MAVFRALQLGDMLCAVPAFRALRGALDGARITLIGLPWAAAFAARFAQYFDDFLSFPGYPGLPEQVPDARRLSAFVGSALERQFDLAIQMHGDGRISNRVVAALGARAKAGFCVPGSRSTPSFLPYSANGPEVRRLLRLAAFLGAAPAGEQLEFPLRAEDVAEFERFAAARRLPAGGYVCLHPGARASSRRWPPSQYAAAGDALSAEYGMPVLLTGGQDEVDLVEHVRRAMRAPAANGAGPISAGALAVLLVRARLLVCNDTGVSHLAAALRVPSVIVFRQSHADIRRWAPVDARLHRRVWDPSGSRLDEVLTQARALLGPAPAAGPIAPGPAP